MKRFLITGAAGFIGSVLARKIIAEGHTVYTIDNLSTGYAYNIPGGVHFIEGNVYDSGIIEQLGSARFDAIFHIAGQSSGEISFENPVYDLQTNTQSTLMLLDYARRTGCKKFIYASTMSVYGDQDVLPVNEQHIPNPKSFYAVGKLASEHYLKIYSGYGIDCAALRLFNVYGPGQNMDNLKQGMVSIFLAQALTEGKITIKGSLDRFRDFVYIDDVTAAFEKALINSSGFQVFNIAGGAKTTVADVLREIQLNFETPLEIIIREGTPGDQFGIFADNNLAKQVLNWYPEVSFKEGFQRMFQWAKSSK